MRSTWLKSAIGASSALVAMSAPSLAQETVSAPDVKIGAKTLLDASYPADGPGAAMIVSRGGKVLFVGGRGLASIEARRPIGPATVFRLGSITKQFTAAVVLQLVAEGRLGLDDPIARFFPEWPGAGARATVRQLLNHTSGLQDYTKIPGFMGSDSTTRPMSTADLLAVIRSRPAVSEPGERWEYNNGGYVVVGAIVEKLTGKAWHEVIVERIVRPMGLTSITYADAVPSVAALASGYSEENGRQRPARGVHISVAHAAGGLVGSAQDLGRWAQALHGGRVVSSSLYQEMVQPARLTDGSTRPYGFGLRLQRIRDRPALVHGGSGRGLDADSIYVPSEHLFVAVLANTDDPATDPSTLARRVAALALGDPIPTFQRTAVHTGGIEPWFGSYRADRGPPVTFFARSGKLYLGRGDDEKEVYGAGHNRFFVGSDPLVWFQLSRRDDHSLHMEMHRPETSATWYAVRTGAVPSPLAIDPSTLRSYEGTFQTETIVVKVAVDDAGGLTIAQGDRVPVALRPISQTEFAIEGGPMRVVFQTVHGQGERITLRRGAQELHGRRIERQ